MTEKKKKPGIIALDIVIALLCLALVGAAAFAISSFYDSFGWSYDEDSFYYRLSDGDYSQMVEMYHYNESNNVSADAELKEYYAVAEYFEAASWYKAYSEAGDSERAAEYLSGMREAESGMAALAIVAGDICDALGIEE